MSQDIPAVPGAVFAGLLRAVLSIVSPGMREPVDTSAASSITRTAPTQSFSRQHDASSGGEPQSGPALAADGCIAGAPTVFRNVRSPVSPESQTP